MPGSIQSGSTTYHFISLKGQIEPGVLKVEEISRPGVNGVALRQVQKRADKFEMTGLVDCDNLAAALTLYAAYAALRGTLVTVTDDYGGSAASVICLDTKREKLVPLLAAAGGISTFKLALMTVRFTFQQTMTI